MGAPRVLVSSPVPAVPRWLCGAVYGEGCEASPYLLCHAEERQAVLNQHVEHVAVLGIRHTPAASRLACGQGVVEGQK